MLQGFVTEADPSCKRINTAAVAISPGLPVAVGRCQTEGVHVSQGSRRDAVSTHGPDHGVSASFQEQTHQLKVA